MTQKYSVIHQVPCQSAFNRQKPTGHESSCWKPGFMYQLLTALVQLGTD